MRSSRSSSSSRSPVYFVVLHVFQVCRLTVSQLAAYLATSDRPSCLVVVLLLAARPRIASSIVSRRGARAWAPRGGLGAVVAALVAAADLLCARRALRARSRCPRRAAASDASAAMPARVRQLDEPLHLARMRRARRSALIVSPSCRLPPRSNHSMTCRVSSVREVAVGHVGDGGANQLARDAVGALQLAFVFQLELAGDRRQRGVDVGDARHDRLFAVDAARAARRSRRRFPWPRSAGAG